MKRTLLFIFTSIFFLGSLMFMSSCDGDTILDILDPNDSLTPLDNLGWIGGDEDLEGIEDDIIFGSGTLPSSVDLSANFPPIGDQGQYGTCVAWATGYNHKTYMNAALDGTTVFDDTKMFSPKYLFWAIDGSLKGADCNGTGFEAAYDVMLSSGIANLQTTPYTSLGDCSGSTSSWDAAASLNKISNYREIALDDLATIKKYLAQGRALAFGAKLGDNFMAWNSSAVLSSETYNYSGMHAYHAMILCGYDDSKSAFRVVNSWGTSWGDNGYIWVDYNFFMNEFAFCAFAATNDRTDPDNDDNNVVDDPNSGYDLLAWEFEDEDNGGVNRTAHYNAFNSGSLQVPASMDWNILLVYYNAYNANDYGILLYDLYSNDDFSAIDPSWAYNGNGDLGSNGDAIPTGGNWWNYVDVDAGESVAAAVYWDDPDPSTVRFAWPYEVPTSVNGEYYLVIIADGYDVISEFDESNNYFYLTDPQGGPLTFVNGDMTETPATKSHLKNLQPQMGDDSPAQTVISKSNLNAYSTKEIQTLLMDRLATGDIKRKAEAFIKTNKNKFKKSRDH